MYEAVTLSLDYKDNMNMILDTYTSTLANA